MKTPAISIIIPVYNTEKYLTQCFDSLINQTFQDFEIICVDDGSTDDSRKILSQYHQKVLLKISEHKGVGYARNLGLKFAKGKYIHFLDSDDYFEPDMLETLYNSAEQNNVDIVVLSAKKVDKNGNALPTNDFWPVNKKKAPYNRVFNWKEYTSDILAIFAPEPWNIFCRRDLILKNNLQFSELKSSNGADINFIARFCANRILILDKEFINYRYNRNNSITSSRNYINMIKARIKLKEYLVKQGLYNTLKEAFESNITSIIIYIKSQLSQKEFKMFIADFKDVWPKEWKKYNAILMKPNLNPTIFSEIVSGNSVILWGASKFITNFIKEYKINNKNIIGFIDKDAQKWGKFINDYQIYPPEKLKELSPQKIVITIINYQNERIIEIQKYVKSCLDKDIEIVSI